MTLSIDLSPSALALLRQSYGDDLSKAALEALALDGYRAGRFSRFQVQELLGFDNRWDTENWLGTRGAAMQYSHSDLESDGETMRRLV